LHRGAAPFVALSQTTRASLAVEYASMHSARMSILAGTALALIFAVSTTAGAAPQVNSGINPVTRDYSTPGSMPKPSAPITPADDGLRFRGMPSTGEPTPLAPGAAAPAPKVESKPEPKAEPQPAPAAKVEPPKAPVPAPVAAKPGPQPQPLTAEDTDAKFETAPAARRRCARTRHASGCRAARACCGEAYACAERRLRLAGRRQDPRDHRQQAVRALRLAQARS
jgi:outer membrane biosynthesis protein TonB